MKNNKIEIGVGSITGKYLKTPLKLGTPFDTVIIKHYSSNT